MWKKREKELDQKIICDLRVEKSYENNLDAWIDDAKDRSTSEARMRMANPKESLGRRRKIPLSVNI